MNTIDNYVLAQSEEVRPSLLQVLSAIRAAIPDAQERISWSMPTFWKGRSLIHVAAAVKHIGIYPGPEAIEAFRDRLKEYSISKGTVRLPLGAEMPLELVSDIARWCYDNYGRSWGQTPWQDSKWPT